ncbi:MAG: TipAS antibiotic-recognition domain-containing protein, partial [Longimicrobiales bacterium]
ADAMVQGIDPDADAARALAERARLHIDRRYYACSHEMHSALADMYTADDRFRAHYDDRVDGLAEYVAAAIKANAARHT